MSYLVIFYFDMQIIKIETGQYLKKVKFNKFYHFNY